VAYSIDAGFHVFLFTLKKDEAIVLEKLQNLRTYDGESILERYILTGIGRNGSQVIN